MFKKGGCGHFAKLGGRNVGPIWLILGFLGTTESSWYTFTRFTDNHIRVLAGLPEVVEEAPKVEEEKNEVEALNAVNEPQLSPRSVGSDVE